MSKWFSGYCHVEGCNKTNEEDITLNDYYFCEEHIAESGGL